jgi:hypothetical protein
MRQMILADLQAAGRPTPLPFNPSPTTTRSRDRRHQGRERKRPKASQHDTALRRLNQDRKRVLAQVPAALRESQKILDFTCIS